MTTLQELRRLEAEARKWMDPVPFTVEHKRQHEEARVMQHREYAYCDGRKLLGEKERAELIAATLNALPALLDVVEAAQLVYSMDTDGTASVAYADIQALHEALGRLQDALPTGKEPA